MNIHERDITLRNSMHFNIFQHVSAYFSLLYLAVVLQAFAKLAHVAQK